MSRSFIVASIAMSLVAVPAIAQGSATPALPVTKSGTIAAPPAGQAQVVFYRPGSLVGAALGCTIYEQGQQIARLGSGKYWVITHAPGKVKFNTRAENVDELTLELEPGETYFVKCKLGIGIVGGRPNISPATADEFSGKAKGLTLWKPDVK